MNNLFNKRNKMYVIIDIHLFVGNELNQRFLHVMANYKNRNARKQVKPMRQGIGRSY